MIISHPCITQSGLTHEHMLGEAETQPECLPPPTQGSGHVRWRWRAQVEVEVWSKRGRGGSVSVSADLGNPRIRAEEKSR